MRVLHVNDYREGGGAEVLMHRTVALLNERGHETRIFTSEDVPGHRRTALSYISSRRACRALQATLDEFKPGAVHLHNYYHELSPGILSVLDRMRRQRELRIVITAHDGNLICPNSGLCAFDGGRRRVVSPDELRSFASLLRHRWDHRGIGHSLLKLAQHLWNYRLRDRRSAIDCVICPSRFMQRLIALSGRPAVYLPHPIQSDNLSAARQTSRSETLQLVFAGRIEPEKGIAEFLVGMPADFPGRIVIIGEGSDLPRCREVVAARELGDRIQFAGRLSHNETIKVIAQSHVLILPSLVPENCPMSLTEALAAGTNILATDLGGSPEIVEQAGTGFLCTPGCADTLRDALDRIVAAHKSGELNSFNASDFLAERNEASYIEHLLQLYGQSGLDPPVFCSKR